MKERRAWEADVPSLKDAFAGRLKIGAAVNSWNFEEGSPSAEAIRKQFSVLTPENEMKPEPLQPREGEFHFERADRFAAFCGENGIRLRGHTLVWHSQCPSWFFEKPDGSPAEKDLLLRRMREHIGTVVSRYRGKVAVWDAANEVLRDEGGLRESKWYRIAGEEYIAEAFRAAREADPDARLILNDYNLESSDAKTDTMAALADRLLAAGVPLDGVGLQMHLDLWTDMDRLRANVSKIAALRKRWPKFCLEVTELDMSVYRFLDPAQDIEWTTELERLFREKYTELFRFYLELADEGLLDSVVFWGLNDGVSWLNGFPRRRKNYPLLIGRDWILKDAFYDVAALGEK